MLLVVLLITLCCQHTTFAEDEYEADLSEELEDDLISELDLGTVSYTCFICLLVFISVHKKL